MTLFQKTFFLLSHALHRPEEREDQPRPTAAQRGATMAGPIPGLSVKAQRWLAENTEAAWYHEKSRESAHNFLGYL